MLRGNCFRGIQALTSRMVAAVMTSSSSGDFCPSDRLGGGEFILTTYRRGRVLVVNHPYSVRATSQHAGRGRGRGPAGDRFRTVYLPFDVRPSVDDVPRSVLARSRRDRRRKTEPARWKKPRHTRTRARRRRRRRFC